MTSIAVTDLKRPRELRGILERAREVVVTKDGRPFAIMIGVDPEGTEDTLREVRRALFSTSVLRARRRATAAPISAEEIQAEIDAQRTRQLAELAAAGIVTLPTQPASRLPPTPQRIAGRPLSDIVRDDRR